MSLTLDLAHTTITIQTYATGLLSALAHDLVIDATPSSGTIQKDPPQATLVFSPSGLKVLGVLKRGTVDTEVLSASDRASIQSRIRDEVLSSFREIRVSGTMDSSGRIRFTIEGGRRPVSFDGTGRREGQRVRGTVDLSLSQLGISEVKGPLGAVKVKDRVTVEWEVRFVG